MKNYRPAKKRIEVSVGESVRIVRELQELSQKQLAGLTGIPQATISAIENGRVNLGVGRAKVLARYTTAAWPKCLIWIKRGDSLRLDTLASPLCDRRLHEDRHAAPSAVTAQSDLPHREKIIIRAICLSARCGCPRAMLVKRLRAPETDGWAARQSR